MTTVSEQLDQVDTRLAMYIAAESSILSGAQSYSIGNRSLTRADLQFIAKKITELYAEKRRLERGGFITSHRVVPRDF
jgi:hypothetical protein